MKLLKTIRKLLWGLIIAYMIAWHNFYYPIERYLLQGNSKVKIEIVEEQEEEEDL